MSYTDYGLILFLVIVVVVGIGGFVIANRD
jgi:hypothetical protein